MPKITPGKKYLKRYTEEDLEKAIQAVGNGMPKKTAAVKYNVPRATLQFRLGNNFVKTRPGPSTVLTADEENALVNWIITSSRKGFPRRREDLVKSVKEFLDKNPRENQFIDNTPGEGWYKLFMKRHPEITERTSEAVTSASSKVSERQIRNWFKQIEDYMKENNLMHIFNEPSRILNGDETNFILCPKNTKVLAPKGERNIYEVDHAQAKSCVTVMFTFSADGKVTPPMIIFPLKKMRKEIQRSVPEEWGIGLSDNGWMQAATFFQYIKNVLHPALVKNNVQFPVILFVDGHKSHTTLELSQLCQNLGIILIALYPNATRILQPADVAAFRPVKALWRKAVLEWRINNISKTMLKTDVGPILKVLLPKIKAETVKNGFRTTGLCPFNPDAVDYSKCLVRPKEVYQQGPATSHSFLSQAEFHKIIGPDLARKMKNQLIGPSKEAKILYDIYRYFSPIQGKDPEVIEEHEKTEEREETIITEDVQEYEIIQEREDPVKIEDREHEMTEKREGLVRIDEKEKYEVKKYEEMIGPVATEDRKSSESIDETVKPPLLEQKDNEITEEREDPTGIEKRGQSVIMEDITEFEITKQPREREIRWKRKLSDKESEKHKITGEREEYEFDIGRQLLRQVINTREYETEETEFETIESEKSDRTLIIVPEKVNDEGIVNSNDKKEVSNIELIAQNDDVPEPAQNLEITTELYVEPNLLTTSSPQPSTSRQDNVFIDEKLSPTTYSPQPSTSRQDIVFIDKKLAQTTSLPPLTSQQDIVFIDGKWIPIDKIPITIAKESPVKKTLSEFLIFPKTPIKRGRLNQEGRTFVLTSKAWEEDEIKKQNKKNKEMQIKEEKKKQRLKKAEETRLKKERKNTENLKKKCIKIESQASKDAKDNAKKPKILQNILIKPANKNPINVQPSQENYMTVKEEKHTDIEGTRNQHKKSEQDTKKDSKRLMPANENLRATQQTQNKNITVKEEKHTIHIKDTRVQQKDSNKDRKELMPLSDKQLLNMLEDDYD